MKKKQFKKYCGEKVFTFISIFEIHIAGDESSVWGDRKNNSADRTSVGGDRRNNKGDETSIASYKTFVGGDIENNLGDRISVEGDMISV